MARSRLSASIVCFSLWSLAACQSQNPAKGEQPTSTAPKTIELPGIDSSKLTTREKEQWSASVSELLAPCSDQAVSLAQCVTEQRKCDACVPAAEFMLEQVTRGKTPSVSEAAFRARFMPDEVREIEIGSSPGKGAPAEEALVTIVEWADFECPFCAMASPLLGKAVSQNSKTTRLVFKHYPLSSHEHAEAAARAAVAAGMQGKFWEMHDQMFKNQGALDDKGLIELAKNLALDLDAFNAARKSEAVADAVAADRKQADKLGLSGTPTIYINGRPFDLERFDISEDLLTWIDLEVKLRSGSQQGAAQKPALAPLGAEDPQAAAGEQPKGEAAGEDRPVKAQLPAPKASAAPPATPAPQSGQASQAVSGGD